MRGGDGPPGTPSALPGGRLLDRRDLLGSLAQGDREGGHWVRVHRPAMACRFEVVLASADARHVPAARAALDEVDALEARLTVFRDTSELVRVNRRAAAGAVPVSEELFRILALCQTLHAATGGAFDPTSTPLSRCWGFLARQGRRPSPQELDEARARVGMDRVVLDAKERTVRFAIPGVELNLGSLGKGWALDRIAAGLRRRGLRRGLTGAGGSSFLGWGNESWSLALRPGGLALGTLRLRGAGLGVSGAGEQSFEAGGRRYGHVLDPRTGQPAEGVRAACVLANDAATADALATALLVGGPALARAYAEGHPDTLAALLLDEDPSTLRVYGARPGVGIEPAAGLGLAPGPGPMPVTPS